MTRLNTTGRLTLVCMAFILVLAIVMSYARA